LLILREHEALSVVIKTKRIAQKTGAIFAILYIKGLRGAIAGAADMADAPAKTIDESEGDIP
jgi:hypothetical protein